MEKLSNILLKAPVITPSTAAMTLGLGDTSIRDIDSQLVTTGQL